MIGFIQDIEGHLKNVDELELQRKIQHFRRLNIENLDDQELLQEIYNVLMWNNNFVYRTNCLAYPVGTPFFRVRRLCGSTIPFPNFNIYSDFWEPPSDAVINYGRLHKIGEPMLYVTPGDTTVPIKETKVQEGEYYALIHYIANKEVKANIIGGMYDYDAIGFSDRKAITAHETYNNFLYTEFSRDVGVGTEYLYRVSELIAKNFFDLPPREIQDAWAYSSICDKTKYNVCFRPEIAHEVLELKGAMICKKTDDDSINVYCIALPKEDKKGISFYQLGSEVQKAVFPDIFYQKE